MVSPVTRGTHRPRFQMPVMPHTRLGWWAVGLLLLLAPYPAYWVVLHDSSLPDSWVVVVLAAIALPPLVLGVVALSRRQARSIILSVLFGLAVVQIVWGVILAVSFALE